MGKPNIPVQSKERRVAGVYEVVLGFGKKENLDEARRCPQCAVATCLPACPLGVDIPGFIRLLREDDAAGALAKVRQQSPFPAVCGRVCPAPCEDACVFHEDGAPIAIRTLERYASDFGKAKQAKDQKISKSQLGKVAIIGSGPTGMTAAFYLAQEGFKVTMYEAMPEPGGLLRYGIPEFRLPVKVIGEQFALLSALGVEVVVNAFVGGTHSVTDWLGSNHIVLLAMGAGFPDALETKGSELGCVFFSTEFLMRCQALTKNVRFHDPRLWPGVRTVVVGAGPSALDAARLSLRAGQKVTLVFDGLEEQLNVRPLDLVLAQEEGLELMCPARLTGINSNSTAFVQSVSIEPLAVFEEGEKLVVRPDGLAQVVVEAQTVILAKGSRPNPFIFNHLPQLRSNQNGGIWVDPTTGMTSIERVFAAGNIVTGAGSAVDAMASGKDIAFKIMEHVKNDNQ